MLGAQLTTLRAYVAAVCFASVVFGLYDAPRFLRARQRAVNAARWEKAWFALNQEKGAKADSALAQSNGQNNDTVNAALDASISVGGSWSKAEDEMAKADDSYALQRAYAVLIGSVFGGHILLLLGVELWRRRRAVTTRPSN